MIHEVPAFTKSKCQIEATSEPSHWSLAAVCGSFKPTWDRMYSRGPNRWVAVAQHLALEVLRACPCAGIGSVKVPSVPVDLSTCRLQAPKDCASKTDHPLHEAIKQSVPILVDEWSGPYLPKLGCPVGVGNPAMATPCTHPPPPHFRSRSGQEKVLDHSVLGHPPVISFVLQRLCSVLQPLPLRQLRRTSYNLFIIL